MNTLEAQKELITAIDQAESEQERKTLKSRLNDLIQKQIDLERLREQEDALRVDIAIQSNL